MLPGATFYDCVNTKYLDDKMSIFEDYGAFNNQIEIP